MAARPGATVPTRATALVLAALATGIPLLLLILGLSIRTIEALRDPPMAFELVPEPPEPPPEPQPPRPSPAKPAEQAAAPAPAAPRPATLLDQSVAILPQPPQPLAADMSGAGMTTAPGAGSGTGGDGPGGNGSGLVGGTTRPVLLPVPVRTEARWIYKPAIWELQAYNPPMAANEKVTGQVLLSCRVLRNRRVRDCRVTAETPGGFGFGAAALEATELFRLAPPTIDGIPDEKRRVEIPVTFHNRR